MNTFVLILPNIFKTIFFSKYKLCNYLMHKQYTNISLVCLSLDDHDVFFLNICSKMEKKIDYFYMCILYKY